MDLVGDVPEVGIARRRVERALPRRHRTEARGGARDTVGQGQGRREQRHARQPGREPTPGDVPLAQQQRRAQGEQQQEQRERIHARLDPGRRTLVRSSA
ncbi:MAG: hypothetical protein M5U13_00265 [Thermoanaerobaculia bacterium]|nr:hypothetical protein [Thermoanaerobaculia bacterium]